MKETVKRICERYCGKEIETKEELIKSKLINSFSLLEMICEIESKFEIEFEPGDVSKAENFSTVENIVKLLINKGITYEI